MSDYLERLANKIDKQYTIRRLSDTHTEKVPVIKTKCLGLDWALRCGGIPRGRIIEVFGNESSGKTTLCLMIADAFLKAGGNILYMDVEHALDPTYMKKMGLDLSSIGWNQPDSMEEALDIVGTAISTAEKEDKLVIVVDSVAALTPQKEIDNGMDKDTIGLQARLMGKFLRKAKGTVYKNGCTLIFINQIRMKIGVFWGNPVDTPGGKALKFYSSIRLEVNKIKTLKKGAKAIGIRSRIKVVKNKVGCPFFITNVEMRGGKGIDKALNTYETLKEVGLLNGMDIEGVKKLLNKKPKALKKLRKKLLEE